MESKLGCFFSGSQFYAMSSTLNRITFKEKSNSDSEMLAPMKKTKCQDAPGTDVFMWSKLMFTQ
jgi:hypothetical protein